MVALALVLVAATTATARAEDSAAGVDDSAELAKKLQNPIAGSTAPAARCAPHIRAETERPRAASIAPFTAHGV